VGIEIIVIAVLMSAVAGYATHRYFASAKDALSSFREVEKLKIQHHSEEFAEIDRRLQKLHDEVHRYMIGGKGR